MTAAHWDSADDEQLKSLHAQGRSLHSIAAEMGRSKATISKHSARLGLSWDRTRTANAAHAVAVDNKARRAVIIARMYTRMEHLQDRLEAPEFRAILKGAYGTEGPETLDFVPTADERNIADTLSRYTVSATKLEAVDATNGVEREKSLLTQLGEALGVTGPPP